MILLIKVTGQTAQLTDQFSLIHQFYDRFDYDAIAVTGNDHNSKMEPMIIHDRRQTNITIKLPSTWITNSTWQT